MPYDAATYVGTTGWTRPTGDPACWAWPIPTEIDSYRPWAALCAWQAGRCAMCGSTERRLTNDHDYADGMRRGQLCASCNGHEGSCGRPGCACVGYRERPPAAILGISVPHPGWATIRIPEGDETSARTGKIRSRRPSL